jgi:hypothetical protein
MIYGIHSQGVPSRVRFKRAPGGKGYKGTVFIHVPRLIKVMLEVLELPSDTVAAVRMLADSPDWCQVATRRLLELTSDRTGLTAADFLNYLLASRDMRTDYSPRWRTARPIHARQLPAPRPCSLLGPRI